MHFFVFSAHQTDEEALLLLDKESLKVLVPEIGLCKIRKKKNPDYRQEYQKDDSHTGKETTVNDIRNSIWNNPIIQPIDHAII